MASNSNSSSNSKAGRRRRRGGAADYQDEAYPGMKPTPSATRATGDGSSADAVWAGTPPFGPVADTTGPEDAGDPDVAQPVAETADLDESEDAPADSIATEEMRTSRGGTQTPKAKGISKKVLRDGFFAQQYGNIVGNDQAAKLVFDEYLEMVNDTYHPVDPVDKVRAHRLALLYYKRDEILECAETGERNRSVLRHRRRLRFTPAVTLDELLETDLQEVLCRRDGVAYVSAVLEDTLQSVRTAPDSAAAVEAVEKFEKWIGASLQAFEDRVAPGLPGLQHGELSEMAIGDLAKWLRCRLHVLRAEQANLQEEEAKLAAAEEARRRVPAGKHSERIARASREVNREIRRLEWDLAPLRGRGPRGR